MEKIVIFITPVLLSILSILCTILIFVINSIKTDLRGLSASLAATNQNFLMHVSNIKIHQEHRQ